MSFRTALEVERRGLTAKIDSKGPFNYTLNISVLLIDTNQDYNPALIPLWTIFL